MPGIKKSLFFAVIIVGIVVVVLIGTTRQTSDTAPTPTEDGTIFRKAILEDVTGGDSTGEGTTSYKDGEFVHTVSAFMPAEPKGQFYEGWLVKKIAGVPVNIFSTGKLNLVANGQYELSYKDVVDYPEHDDIVITLEKDDDKKPEIHILEGTLNGFAVQ